MIKGLYTVSLYIEYADNHNRTDIAGKEYLNKVVLQAVRDKLVSEYGNENISIAHDNNLEWEE